MTNLQPKQHSEGGDISRRTALRHLALLPIHALGLDALGTTARWAPEEILTHCAAGITACEHLSKGQYEEMSFAYSVLSTYLPALKGIVEQSSTHRKDAARLAAQALLTKARLSLHREGPKRATSYGRQAIIFSKESGNIPLQLVILKTQAWIYACGKQEKKALESVLQAKSLLEAQLDKGPPILSTIHSSIYGGVAKYQARAGQKDEALDALDQANTVFFASPADASDTSIDVEHDYAVLLMEDGLTYYHLDQYGKALEIFAQAIDPNTLVPKMPLSSERVRVEILNNATLASLKNPQKNMELSINLWTAGMQGATDLRSEQRLSEALTAYEIMQALWPGEGRIKELRDLTRHW